MKTDKPMLLNMTAKMETDVKAVAKSMGLNASAFIRMAIANELKKQRK